MAKTNHHYDDYGGNNSYDDNDDMVIWRCLTRCQGLLLSNNSQNASTTMTLRF